jgi:nitrilase
MMHSLRPFIVAAAQVTPVFLNRDATVAKACECIREAGARGARLIVFPEAFIPCYPEWVWEIPPSDGQALDDLYGELLANSVAIPSSATDALCQAAQDARMFVVMGINERNVEASGSSLYCTMLYIDDQGRIMGRHRKLVPTSAERMVWAQGDGNTLGAYETTLGTLGGLICWENYMPLARYALYAEGTQIYAAPTWDHGEVWLSTLRHIAAEGRTYVIGCCMPLRTSDIPDGLRVRYYTDMKEWLNPGESAIVSPLGDLLAGPVKEKEDILYAEIDPQRIGSLRRSFDVAGHYARPDVFHLSVSTAPQPLVSVSALPDGDVAVQAEVVAEGS